MKNKIPKEFAANQKRDEKEIAQALADIRIKFVRWCKYIAWLCLGYLGVFILSKAIAKWIKPHLKECFTGDLATAIAAGFLGFSVIIDSWATSYLKGALQRLSFGIEKSSLPEELKDKLLAASQDINELFKNNFQRFGISVVPALLVSIIDNGNSPVFDKNDPDKIIGYVAKPKRKSEGWIFQTAYLLPVAVATWKIWQLDKFLKQIEKDFYSEYDK